MRDPDVTVEQMLQTATAKTGENIIVSRFVRFKLGETALNSTAVRVPDRRRRRWSDL